MSEPEPDQGVVSEDEPDQGVRERLNARGDDLLGRLVHELVGSPALGAAIGRAFEARGKATQAQETALGLLGIPSSGYVERLTRRLRAISQRLDTIEDSLRRVQDGLRHQSAPFAHRLEAIEEDLAAAKRLLSELHAAGPAAERPGDQEHPGAIKADKAAKPGKGKRSKRAD